MRPVPCSFHCWIRASISAALIFALCNWLSDGGGPRKSANFLIFATPARKPGALANSL